MPPTKRRKLSQPASGPAKSKSTGQKPLAQKQRRPEPIEQAEDSDDDASSDSDASEHDDSGSDNPDEEDDLSGDRENDQESDGANQTGDGEAAVEAEEQLPETFKDLVNIHITAPNCAVSLIMLCSGNCRSTMRSLRCSWLQETYSYPSEIDSAGPPEP